MKYIVWINEGNRWEEQGEGPMTLKQAERIAREIRSECRCRAKYLPVGVESVNTRVASHREGRS
jgi:hypothetical protein